MKRLIGIFVALTLFAAFMTAQVTQPEELSEASKLLREKKYDAAESGLRSFLAANPGNARGWYLLASALHSKNEFKGAVEALKKNQSISQNWPGMYNLAAAYARLGEKKSAFEWLEKSLNNGAAFAVNIETDEDFKGLTHDPEFEAMRAIVTQKRNPCDYSEKAREFDFWLGDWEVFVNGRKVGENLIEKGVNGCTLIENWKNNGGGTGKSLNVFDASVGKWKQFYVGSQGGVYLFEGNLEGNKMKFTALTVNTQGAKTHHKFEFTNLEDKTVRQKWDTSTDGGKSFNNVWDSIYKKKKGTRVEGKEVSFDSSDGVKLFGDVYESSKGKSAPLVLLFHQGGGDVRGEYATHIPQLLAKGYNVLAVDLRTGGNRFGSENRTVKKLGETKYGYCDAYPDIEASLDFARKNGFNGKTAAWGSSFSAALVFQLAAKRGGDLAGILAFSPASGGPMAACKPSLFASKVNIPVLALRPASETKSPNAKAQLKYFTELGIDTYIAENGVHGSSMLNAERVKGDVSAHWETVFAFLAKTLEN